MRVHIPGLPHNDPVRATEYCAFAQRIRRLADALAGLGHEVYVYAGPGNDTAANHVQTISAADRLRWFGEETFTLNVFDQWDPAHPCWAESNAAAISSIRERLGPTDIIGITAGRCQQAIARAFPGHVKAELFAGYEGIMPELTHICFESEAWRHYQYGRCGINDGRFFDAVLPNFFDPADYDFRADKDDYLLFLGRLTPRKGLAVVAELAEHHWVITAGQGDERVPGAEHVGVVVGDDKRKLLAGARAVIVATSYIEPFGGVAVEAMLSGTPVITTPWGAFSETVVPGVGFRCSTLLDFQKAAAFADQLLPLQIHNYAKNRYSTAVVAPQYDAWLFKLQSLYGEGWYS